jgi:hypothetical protein
MEGVRYVLLWVLGKEARSKEGQNRDVEEGIIEEEDEKDTDVLQPG